MPLLLVSHSPFLDKIYILARSTCVYTHTHTHTHTHTYIYTHKHTLVVTSGVSTYQNKCIDWTDSPQKFSFSLKLLFFETSIHDMTEVGILFSLFFYRMCV